MAVNALDEGTKATPAIADGKLYVRTYGALYCFERGDEDGTPIPGASRASR
jgi:hypothetical protein